MASISLGMVKMQMMKFFYFFGLFIVFSRIIKYYFTPIKFFKSDFMNIFVLLLNRDNYFEFKCVGYGVITKTYCFGVEYYLSLFQTH